MNQGWDEEVGQEGSGSIVEGLGPPANGLDLAHGQWKPHHEAVLQDDGQKSACEWNQKSQGRTSGDGHSSQGGGESLGMTTSHLPGGWGIGCLDQVTDTEDPKGGSQSEGMEWRVERDVQKRAEYREKTVTLATRVYLGMQRLER